MLVLRSFFKTVALGHFFTFSAILLAAYPLSSLVVFRPDRLALCTSYLLAGFNRLSLLLSDVRQSKRLFKLITSFLA